MTTRYALMRGAAVGVALAAGLGASAQAQTRDANAELRAQLQALQAQVTALQARLDAQEAGQRAVATEASQAQATAGRAALDSQAALQQAQAVPAQIAAAAAATAKPKPSWADATTVGGRMFFTLSNIDQTSNGRATAPSGTGFDIKRFYVAVDHRFNGVYSANLTTDAQYASAIGATQLYIKKAYLQASYSDALNIRLGAADLPWVPFAEDLYGYRFVEPVVADRTRFATSADWGVHAYGKLGPYLSYAASVVDGAGYRAPLRSKTMDVEGRLSARVQDFTIAVGGYSGRLGKSVEGAAPVQHTARRLNALAAYTHGPVRIGAEYFQARNWNNITTTATDEARGYSAFASYQLSPILSVFGRYDHVDPRRTSAPAHDEDYFNVGLNYQPVQIVSLALVYKRDRVDAGLLNTTNGVIGGTAEGAYDELGLFGQFRW